MQHRSASEVDPAGPASDAVARFGRDLGRLIDIDRDRVLVAVSGGPDSLALLLLTHALIGDRCVAATVDHGLRAASADEAAFVSRLCASRGIAHDILTGDVPDRAGRTRNLSARARALRYRLLDQARVDCGARWLATAHHADDQLETFVMRANRGAGVAGLAGIRARGATTIRPLLGWRRADLAAIVRQAGVTAVDDPTNVDDRFDRARLRKLLADADWLDPVRIGDSAAALADADDALRWAADSAYRDRVTLSPRERAFRAAGLPAEIARRILIRCLTEIDAGCDAGGPAVTRLVAALGEGRSAMLGDVLATVSRDEGDAPVWHFRPAPPRRSV